ncbi:alkaline phosphatase PhoD [soil metagenome]
MSQPHLSTESADAVTTAPPAALDRRRFVVGMGAVAGVLATSRLPKAWAGGSHEVGNPFALGVASGDPLPDAVVLWTRLAPEPLAGGGMPARDVPVEWQVAEDDGFRRVVRHGTATARPRWAHSVHVDAGGLRPGRWYWYRFKAGSDLSTVGRTRTAPAPGADVDRLRFAFASCQQYEHGYFTAYRHMAGEDLDLVVHLGDYIYEYGRDEYEAPGGNVRHHSEEEITSLADYRNRHAQYRSDSDLQAAHAAFPWVVTWDDHEIDNNWADEVPEADQPVRPFLRRRARGMQAYWEHMPLRRAAQPEGVDMRMYRRFDYGRLARLNVLDTRQYRSDQPCGDEFPGDCTGRFRPSRTITGARQERWLYRGLDRSPARWNVLAQQVFLAQIHLWLDGEDGYYVDGWDGYVASRDRLLEFIRRRRPSNPVVLTGDWHANWAADLKADFDDPDSATLGSELVGTSITSGGDGSPSAAYGETVLKRNPHIGYFNNQRGYVRCDLDRRRWRSDFRVVPYVRRRGAPVRTAASFTIDDGRPGAVPR